MVSSGLLRRVALVTTQKTPFFIVTAVKTSNLTLKETWLGFEVLAAVVMNVAIFWDIAPCNPYVNRRFGGTTLLATCSKLLFCSAEFLP
jgi:hypothetical protein